jgi:hypothetical protein
VNQGAGDGRALVGNQPQKPGCEVKVQSVSKQIGQRNRAFEKAAVGRFPKIEKGREFQTGENLKWSEMGSFSGESFVGQIFQGRTSSNIPFCILCFK